MNIELLRRVKDHILEHPEQFDMGIAYRSNDCGTVGCIAGWTCVLSSSKPEDRGWDVWDQIQNKADELLDITRDESSRLFWEHHWPLEFQDQMNAVHYSQDREEKRAKITADRIEHFIKTGK